MTVDVAPRTLSATGALSPSVPVAFEGLFGWFSQGFSRRGVILCGTHGYEQLSAHRSWRALAESIAATGCSVLRFDYPGEGDSADDGAGHIDSWIASIRQAVRFLREAAGASEIVLVGLRFGGTLAVLAAQEGGVDRLALLAPFTSGRIYLREMRMQARTLGRLADGTPLPEPSNGLSVGGFHLGENFVSDIGQIDIAKIQAAPALRILILGADAAGLSARYSVLGAQVETAPFVGLGALLSNPLFAQTPKEAFAAVSAFAAEGAMSRLAPVLTTQPTTGISGDGWREEPIQFGNGLFGILCRPRSVSGGPTVLFVNSGTNLHTGWGRQVTVRARRLAALGIPSLRIDLRSIGDSPDRVDGASPLYTLAPLDDVRSALDHLDRVGLKDVTIVGACSGAHLAFHALCRDVRLSGAVLINLYCFDWDPKDDVEAVTRTVFRSPSTYASMLRQGSAWRRLLRGKVHVAAILAALARVARSQIAHRLARLLRPPPPGGTVARRIAEMRRRGARLRIVYSAGDPGLDDLRLQLGRSPARIAKRLGGPVTVIDATDHDLSTSAAQAQFFDVLTDFLKAGAGN